MSWKIKYNEDTHIIEITYSGNVTGLDLKEAALKRIAIQEETGATMVLADASQSEGAPTTMDLFDLPDKIYQDHKARRDTRIAFILPDGKESKELAHFFKTAAKNRGWHIELFEDRDSAFSWLIADID